MGNSLSIQELPVMQVFYPDPDCVRPNEKPSEPKLEEPSSRICHVPSTYELVNLKNIAYMTAKSFAIVSSKPLVPGHVMVFPFDATNFILDPRNPAAADLYSTAQHVGAAIMALHGVNHFFILTMPAYKLETNYSFKRNCLHILPITEFSEELINRLKNYYEDPMDELVRPALEVMAEAALLREICYYKRSSGVDQHGDGLKTPLVKMYEAGINQHRDGLRTVKMGVMFSYVKAYLPDYVLQ